MPFRLNGHYVDFFSKITGNKQPTPNNYGLKSSYFHFELIVTISLVYGDRIGVRHLV